MLGVGCGDSVVGKSDCKGEEGVRLKTETCAEGGQAASPKFPVSNFHKVNRQEQAIENAFQIHSAAYTPYHHLDRPETVNSRTARSRTFSKPSLENR